jgi:hypothetical protein
MPDERGSISAEEAMGLLAQNPEYQQKLADFKAKQAADDERRRRATAQLRIELDRAGVHIGDIWELANKSRKLPPDAVTILANHLLSGRHNDADTDGIARALAGGRPSGYWSELVRAFRGETRRRAKGGLAVALSAALTEEHLVEYLNLIRDPSLGPSRALLLYPVTRLKEDWVNEFLTSLLTDTELKVQVADDIKWRKRNRPST